MCQKNNVGPLRMLGKKSLVNCFFCDSVVKYPVKGEMTLSVSSLEKELGLK